MIGYVPMLYDFFLVGLVMIGFAITGWLIRKNQLDGDPHLKSELDRRMEEIGELKQQRDTLKSEKQELEVKGKEFSKTFLKLDSDHSALRSSYDDAKTKLTQFEEQEKTRRAKYEEMISQQEATRKALEDEKIRIRREDEERQRQMEEERNRVWAEHENKVIAELADICSQPQLSFRSYDNNNLPEGFHGSLKPDFMIEFLEQYVIFDVKVSEAKNLQNYINDQVQKTAKKVKGNEKIYSSIFLVVPTIAIKDLKKKFFYEEGYTFFVISPESIAPLLALFKKIETYEFAEAMDPQERENIVDLIAAFHFHISTRNANELMLMMHGLETLDKAEKMHPELIAEAIVKKVKMRNINLNTAENKALVANPEKVAQQLLDLVEPRAKISKEELKKVS